MDFGFSTRALHSQPHDKSYNAHSTPIVQSSSFAFESSMHGAKVFSGDERGYIYTRIGNPTVEATEQVISSLECAEDTVLFSSGMAAIFATLMALTRKDDYIISCGTMYGPSVNMAIDILPDLARRTNVLSIEDLHSIDEFLTKETKIVLFETPANPTLDVVDIALVARKVGAWAKREGHRPLIVVDSTFATPYLQQPLSLGADIVIHSGTKYLSGHADLISGCVSGKTEHMKLVRNFRKNTGACISPFDSFLLMRGMKTLALRMERHCENAEVIARFLTNHRKISKVFFPGKADHPNHLAAKTQMRGFGGMVAFEMKGGYEAAIKMLDNLKLITLVISLGSVDSIIQHPASMTHSGMPKEIREAFNITDGLVRISVGIEDVDDLVRDLSQALEFA